MRPDSENKSKSKRQKWPDLRFTGSDLCQNAKTCSCALPFCSGSVSSYNEDDYEVDENTDEEEQEEPEDYCKGIQAVLGCIERSNFNYLDPFMIRAQISHLAHCGVAEAIELVCGEKLKAGLQYFFFKLHRSEIDRSQKMIAFVVVSRHCTPLSHHQVSYACNCLKPGAYL